MKYAVNPRNQTTTNRDKATAVLRDGLMTMLKDADFTILLKNEKS